MINTPICALMASQVILRVLKLSLIHEGIKMDELKIENLINKIKGLIFDHGGLELKIHEVEDHSIIADNMVNIMVEFGLRDDRTLLIAKLKNESILGNIKKQRIIKIPDSKWKIYFPGFFVEEKGNGNYNAYVIVSPQ